MLHHAAVQAHQVVDQDHSSATIFLSCLILKIKKTDIVFWQWNIICNNLDHNQEGVGKGLRRKHVS